MEQGPVVDSSCPSPITTFSENVSSHSDISAGTHNNELVESKNSASTSIIVLNVRRRCWEEAFASEPESTTPEPDDLQMENIVEVDISSTSDSNCKSSKEETIISCEAHPGCLKSFKNVREYEDHYNLRHRHKCIICSKSLPSAHILELHVLETHDTLFSLMAERKPMLACFMESCSSTFWKLEERKEHCLGEHGFPKSFKLWDLSTSSSGSKHGKKSGSSQRVKGKATEKQKLKGENPASFKDDKMDTENIHVSSEVSSTTLDPPVPAVQPILTDEPMKLDSTVSEGRTAQGKPLSKPKCKNQEKSVPNQITFGHSASRAFKPKHTFGLAKPEGISSSSTSSKMDLSDIRDVLPTATATTILN